MDAENFSPDIELAKFKNTVTSRLLATIIFALDESRKASYDNIKKIYQESNFITDKKIYFDKNLDKLCEFSWINRKKPKHKKEYIYIDRDKYEKLLEWAFEYHFRDYSTVSELFVMKRQGQILQDIMKEFVNSVEMNHLVISEEEYLEICKQAKRERSMRDPLKYGFVIKSNNKIEMHFITYQAIQTYFSWAKVDQSFDEAFNEFLEKEGVVETLTNKYRELKHNLATSEREKDNLQKIVGKALPYLPKIRISDYPPSRINKILEQLKSDYKNFDENDRHEIFKKDLRDVFLLFGLEVIDADESKKLSDREDKPDLVLVSLFSNTPYVAFVEVKTNRKPNTDKLSDKFSDTNRENYWKKLLPSIPRDIFEERRIVATLGYSTIGESLKRTAEGCPTPYAIIKAPIILKLFERHIKSGSYDINSLEKILNVRGIVDEQDNLGLP